MVTIKIKFKRSANASKSGKLYYLIRHKENTRRISTDFEVRPDEWDDKKQAVCFSDSNRISVLNDIQRNLDCSLAFLKRIAGKLDGGTTVNVLDLMVQQFNERSKHENFFSFMHCLINQLQENGQFGTARNYQRAKQSFQSFSENRTVYFSEMTEMLLLDYERWLKQKGIAKNSLSFYLRILRSVYNKAVEYAYIEQSFPFKKVYTGVDRTRNRAINESLIVKLKDLHIEDSLSLCITRDLFLFSFYSRGMAFVDMAFLKKSNLKGNVLFYKRHKTTQQMAVYLEPCIKEIIDRYSWISDKCGYLLPILSETDDKRAYKQYQNRMSYYNKLLKRISQMLNLETPLTSYVARHSWATIARDKKIPLSVISAGMGHSSESITRIYLSCLNASVIDEANYLILSTLGEK
jgi:integrase